MADKPTISKHDQAILKVGSLMGIESLSAAEGARFKQYVEAARVGEAAEPEEADEDA